MMLDAPKAAERRRARQRRYRRRQAGGRIAVSVEVDRDLVSWLVRTQWLTPPREYYSRCEVADALARLLADSVRG
jgi:hypothetical protein